MGETKDWGARLREGRRGFLAAAILVLAGIILIYIANYVLSATTPSQALVAYIGVFVVAAGILYGASTLLVRE
jgi:uncharacterized membrane protein HdeD (DUF308 family)